jgi:hypothetical protein
MKRVLFCSILTLLVLAIAPAAFSASPLLTFSVSSVDTTADTLLDHALLVEGHFNASPVPLAAGTYEFELAIYETAESSKALWKRKEPLEVAYGGILHATVYNVSGFAFYDRDDSTGDVHFASVRYLQLSLPLLGKTFPRVRIESRRNALAVTRIFQYHLFETWEKQAMTDIPPQIREKILGFIENKQSDEVVNTLVKKFVEQSLLIDELQNRLEKLEASNK